MGTLIRAANLAGFEDLSQQLGADPADLLAHFHIDPDVLKDPDAYLPFRNVAALLERAAREYNCPDLGLRLVQWQGLGMLGPVAVIARNSRTVLEAFASLARYLHVHGPALKLTLLGQNADGDYGFDFRIDEPAIHALAQSYELSIGNGHRMLRMLAGPSATPVRVRFMHAPQSSRANYIRAFSCPVEFESDYCGIDIRAEDMRRPILDSDAQTRHLAQRFLESSQPPDISTVDRVNELIQRLLPTGQCSIAVVAEQLAVHPRTLQRALKAANTSYETLLDAVRKQKAEHYLTQTSMRMNQVSGLLGYTDQSTFNRACDRWFAMKPRQLRNTQSGPTNLEH